MSDLTKRSQAERLAIAEALLASVWEEYRKGIVDRENGQLAVNIQVNVNRIIWKLNTLDNMSDANNGNGSISRKDFLQAIKNDPVGKMLCRRYNLDGFIEKFPENDLCKMQKFTRY